MTRTNPDAPSQFCACCSTNAQWLEDHFLGTDATPEEADAEDWADGILGAFSDSRDWPDNAPTRDELVALIEQWADHRLQ